MEFLKDFNGPASIMLSDVKPSLIKLIPKRLIFLVLSKAQFTTYNKQ
jgi:hypothetical protein